MRRSSINEVKAEIAAALNTEKLSAVSLHSPLGLGRTKRSDGENLLAVRIFKQGSFWRNKFEWFRKITSGEVDIQFVGEVNALPPVVEAQKENQPWNRQRVRPLKIGSSISHGAVTAGTLGCFVRNPNGYTFILSNNHVIANQNQANRHDKICQPGTYDGGSVEKDEVATLEKWITIQEKNNLVDAAIAMTSEHEDHTSLDALGKLNGQYTDEIEPGQIVAKFGRTTGVTLGRVTAVEVDNVGVGFSDGLRHFDQQIEIEGAEDVAFCQGGDSGSMVVSASDGRKGSHYALGLLFAGGPRGGSNGKGLTYVNYLTNVLKALDVRLCY